MGFAFPALSKTHSNSFFENLIVTKAITPILSFYLSRAASSSFVIFGGIDSSQTQGDLVYQPLSYEAFWETSIVGLGVQGKLVPEVPSFLAILDSASSLINLPPAVALPFFKSFGATADAQGMATIGCTAIPTLQLSIPFGGFLFALDPRDLKWSIVSGNAALCQLPIMSNAQVGTLYFTTAAADLLSDI